MPWQEGFGGERGRLEEVLGGAVVKLATALHGTADQLVKAVPDYPMERIVASCVTILARIWQEERPLGVKFACKNGLPARRRVPTSRQEPLDSAVVQVAVQI